MSPRMVKTSQEQLDLWVNGESTHRQLQGDDYECCPDFSCCHPTLLQPVEVREAFRSASLARRNLFLMPFLGGLLKKEAPDVRAYITDGKGEVPS